MSMLAEQLETEPADATRRLFESHRRRIFGYCLGQLGNHHDAEDAVQMTFLYAFGCLERGIVPEAELAWLFKIALNVCRTRRRSLGRRRRIEAPTDFDDCEYAMAGPERGDDELLGLSGALAAMPANQRSAILLREWQGLSYAEIGERLTISQSAVETLLFRARRSLASQLRRVPQQVAVMVNAPLLIRLFRRLAPNAAAIKTTAAVVAIGAVSTVGGHELARTPRTPASEHARPVAHTPSLSYRSATIFHRPASMAPAPVRRTSRPHRIAAPSLAEAAVPTAEPRATPPAASVTSIPQPTAPASPAAPTTAAQVSLPTPQLLAEPPAVPVGELSGSAAADAVQAVAQSVEPLAATAGEVATSAVAAVATVVTTAVTPGRP